MQEEINELKINLQAVQSVVKTVLDLQNELSAEFIKFQEQFKSNLKSDLKLIDIVGELHKEVTNINLRVIEIEQEIRITKRLRGEL